MTTENTGKKKYQSLSHGLGITGIIVGVIGLIVSFIPCFGMFAFFFAWISIIISLIALVVALRHDHPKGLIIGAIIISILAGAISYSQYKTLEAVTETIDEVKKEVEGSQP